MNDTMLDGSDLAVLGLGPRACWQEVQAAYRRLAMQVHPDRREAQRGASATEQVEHFRRINEAYERMRRRHEQARLHSMEHIARISQDPSAAELEIEELELRLRHSSSPQLRAAAAMLLGGHPGERSRAALERACCDPDPQVRSAALGALKLTAGRLDVLCGRASVLLHNVRTRRAG